MGFGDFGFESGALEAGGLGPFDERGAVLVREVLLYRGHQAFPHEDVAGAGDEHHEDAGGECAAEADEAVALGVAVVLHADEDDKKAEHHDGVAEGHGPARVGAVLEGDSDAHDSGEGETAEQTVLPDLLLHGGSPVLRSLLGFERPG